MLTQDAYRLTHNEITLRYGIWPEDLPHLLATIGPDPTTAELAAYREQYLADW